MTDDITIRPERPDDVQAIHDLVREAFGRELEADVVAKLRESAGFLADLSLVAVRDSQVVGHIMITELDYPSDAGGQVQSTILAPLAVLPHFQNQGIGDALSRAALERTKEAGYGSMILVGHPNYYPRFGFRPASNWGIRYATPIPDDVFMAVELVPGSLDDAAGTVILPSAFDEA
jgi:putative acetyltransferase